MDAIEEITAVRSSTRRLLAELGGGTATDDDGAPSAYPRATWRLLADRLGLQGVRVPEGLGGAGMGLAAELVVHEEMGRALHGGPYLPTVAQALPGLLSASVDGEHRPEVVRLVDGVLAGELAIGVLATWETAPLATVAARGGQVAGERTVVDGTARMVLAGADIDGLLVVTDADPGPPLLMWVAADAAGVSIERLETLDLTRGLADVVLDGAEATVLASGPAALAAGEAITTGGVLALCAEAVGVAAASLEMAVAYLGVREQFGRVLAEFQSLKHQAADLYVRVESARSALSFAVDALEAGAGAWPGPEQAAALAVARRRCGEVAFHVACENIHLHGGIGFTWEHPAHLYYRRAKTIQTLLDPRGEQGRVLAAAVNDLYAVGQ